jgi:uracil-DNA glycosylase family 4
VNKNFLSEMGINEIYSDEPQDFFKKKSSTSQNQTLNVNLSTLPITKSFDNKQDELNSPEFLAKEARKIAEECNSLEQLKEALNNYKKLSICKMAQNTVFSDGNPNSDIMVIGEAPGANEDEEGIPFCGMSGKLLDKMFESIGLSRDKNIYITNSIFWRPPGNRRPTPEESNICLPFVEKHIGIFKPKLIILVGSTAAYALLQTIDPITKLRQSFHSYQNRYLTDEVPVAIIFHPSYLLRQPKQKKTTWFDLLKIKDKFFNEEANIK